MLREDSARFTVIYRLLLCTARDGGDFVLLGHDELGTSVFENAFRDQIVRSAAEGDLPEQDTERIILAAARVGQHVFALNVLNSPQEPIAVMRGLCTLQPWLRLDLEVSVVSVDCHEEVMQEAF